MLFNKKHQKKIQLAWAILTVIIVIGMILLYSPLVQSTPAPAPTTTTGQ